LADFVEVPLAKVPRDSLEGLLEEFASRDGTDYGERETPLADRVSQLHAQLESGELRLVFEADSEHWDILPAPKARELLGPETLDARGLRCPEPVMLLHKAVAELAAGDCLTVLATDPTTLRDIPQFCRFLGHELLSSEERDDEIIYQLRKGNKR
jgi:tRNA 2-thiouridine synthesizing protein A